MRTTWMMAAVAVLAAACSPAKHDASADSTQAMANMPGMDHDADSGAAGTGVPAGYVGRTDKTTAKITDAKYTASNGQWEIRTGPAHIVYAPRDTASGTYTVSTTIEQLEAPRHPEAYGIFFGGQQLDQPAQQKYGYFEVRGTGEYLVKARNGDATTSLIEWTASDAVPKQNASGKAVYQLAVKVGTDSVHFLVNGKPVAAVSARTVPTNGIAGLRVNHNLHISAVPVSIER